MLRTVFASGALIFAASCVYQQIADTCDYFSGAFFDSTEPTNYTLFVSAPQILEEKPPILAFGDPETSSLAVKLVAVESADGTVGGPTGLWPEGMTVDSSEPDLAPVDEDPLAGSSVHRPEPDLLDHGVEWTGG